MNLGFSEEIQDCKHFPLISIMHFWSSSLKSSFKPKLLMLKTIFLALVKSFGTWPFVLDILNFALALLSSFTQFFALHMLLSLYLEFFLVMMLSLQSFSIIWSLSPHWIFFMLLEHRSCYDILISSLYLWWFPWYHPQPSPSSSSLVTYKTNKRRSNTLDIWFFYTPSIQYS